jgi:L-cysteate sulfo-lyase
LAAIPKSQAVKVSTGLMPPKAPRFSLAHLPTPLEPMPRLAGALGISQRLYVKRDDCTGLGFGGNKTRKLEFILGAALAQGADTLVTVGGLQSNHVRQTAAAAARAGLACHAVVDCPLERPGDAYRHSGNVLLDSLFGATLHEAASGTTQAVAKALVETLGREGRRPYLTPLGGSDGVGAQGYVVCAQELLGQLDDQGIDASHVVLCTGSAGTHAGLLAGLRRAGSSIAVVGMSSSDPSAIKEARVRAVMVEVFDAMGEAVPAGWDDDVTVHDRWAGTGYGQPTAQANEAILLLARTEGLLLDPVYTGKAMAGLIGLFEDGSLDGAGDVVFLHTGGAPALFAYADSLAQS